MSERLDGQRFLIVRHPRFRRMFYDPVLRWVALNVPAVRPQFEVRELPVKVSDWSCYALHTAWLQDPVQAWSMPTFRHAEALLRQCDERGIPVVNRVDRLLNPTKFRGSQIMHEAGVRTPRMALIEDRRQFESTLLGLALPLFVRDDWGHAQGMVRIDTANDLRRIPWRQFGRPVAVELVETRDPRDGLYRKYRYVAAGDVGITHHLQISRDWITRGENRVVNDITRNEEQRFISAPDPNHEQLQRARRALGLDFVGFDYGYTNDGELIVWEANPFPYFRFSYDGMAYRNSAIHRTMMAMVRLYFTQAGLPVPEKIERGLALEAAEVDREFRVPGKRHWTEKVRESIRAYAPRLAG